MTIAEPEAYAHGMSRPALWLVLCLLVVPAMRVGAEGTASSDAWLCCSRVPIRLVCAAAPLGSGDNRKSRTYVPDRKICDRI